jgi:putative tricarboxylic transport membrane protein
MIARLAGSAVLGAIGIYVSVVAQRLGIWEFGEPGAGLFPLIFGGTLALLSAMQILQSAATMRLQPRFARHAGATAAASAAMSVRLVIYLSCMVAYAALFQVLGFIVVTALVFMVLLVGAERMRLLPSLAITAGAVGASYVIFGKFLAVPFPPGVLG